MEEAAVALGGGIALGPLLAENATSVLAAGRLRLMELGDIVTLDGRRFYVRGFDPEGVEPRFAYLEDAASGQTISVPFDDELPGTLPRSARGLHLVRDDHAQ